MPQSRKWQLTFNNPAEHGFTHDAIVEAIENLASVVYWCLCDETGSEGTYHTHLYICFQNPKLHTVIGNAFPGAHRENVKGTSQQNRDCVLKDGEKYNKQPDGSYDYVDSSGKRHHWRDLTVTYIFGRTGAGKTRSVMDTYGYANCYRVTDYRHPFDTYDGQDVLIFEEFRSSLKLADMLNYLDGYPLLQPSGLFHQGVLYHQHSPGRAVYGSGQAQPSGVLAADPQGSGALRPG